MQTTNTIKAAAIQLEVATGDVQSNLVRVESLCLEAIAQGATLIALPEFFTSRVALVDQAFSAVLPPDNDAIRLLKRLARNHKCWIGGSMLIADGGQVYNRYHFVEPSGRVHLHDKDLPTMVERGFYTYGKDDGHFQTEVGGVGAAMCWELIRNQTPRRLLGKVDVLMAGTHWWTVNKKWALLNNTIFSGAEEFNQSLCENAPAEMAKRLGVPVVHSSHCGAYTTNHLLFAGSSIALPYDTEFVGSTQIVDAQGQVLAKRHTSEGPGLVVAEIQLGQKSPLLPVEESLWIPELPKAFLFNWHQQNWAAESYYHRVGRQRGLRNAADCTVP